MGTDNTEMDLNQEAPLLAAIGKANPFTVPSGYFEDSAKILRSITLIEDYRFKPEEEFYVPANYFEELSGKIESRVALEQRLDSKNHSGFNLPDQYFDGLSARIFDKIAQENHSIKKPSRKLAPAWLNYAAAACVTIAIGFALFINNRNTGIESQLGKIPEQEIINYLQMHSDLGDTPVIMENINHSYGLEEINGDVTSEDIEQYINTTL